MKLENLKNQLLTKFPDQPAAISALVAASKDIRPPVFISSPTGTGAIAAVVSLMQLLSENPAAARVFRLDMTEFSTNADLDRFNRRLDEVTRLGKDTSCIIFDEIEKAAPAVFKVIEMFVVRGVVLVADGSILDVCDIRVYLGTHFSCINSSNIRARFGAELAAHVRLVVFEARRVQG